MLGFDNVQAIAHKRVLIAGLGGVGSYAAEALARLGVGHFFLVDRDTIEPTNLNRQLLALHSTLGQPKTEVAKARILDIQPQADVRIATRMIDETFPGWLNLQEWDFVVDDIDTLRYKALLLTTCHQLGIPMVSSMEWRNGWVPMVSIRLFIGYLKRSCQQTNADVCRQFSLDLKSFGSFIRSKFLKKEHEVFQDNALASAREISSWKHCCRSAMQALLCL